MGLLSKVFGSRTKRLDIGERFESVSKPVQSFASKYHVVVDKKSKETFGLKLLDSRKTKQFRDRFKEFKLPSEAEILSEVEHDHIVKLIETGMTTDDEEYLLLEYCEGLRMDEAIEYAKDHGFYPKLSIVGGILDAVERIHDAGFVHRDIRPANFVFDKRSQRVKLTDFGISTPATPDFLNARNRTGSPLYMAPEIIRRRPYDHRVDIFSLGVTLFELLTHEHPWPGSENTSQASLNFDTRQPRSLSEIRPDLDKKITDAVQRCLDSNPSKRFKNIKTFRFAVGNLIT